MKYEKLIVTEVKKKDQNLANTVRKPSHTSVA